MVSTRLRAAVMAGPVLPASGQAFFRAQHAGMESQEAKQYGGMSTVRVLASVRIAPVAADLVCDVL